ncbi:hypothetical protein RFI_01978, partial [Reticulomyxa filosa]
YVILFFFLKNKKIYFVYKIGSFFILFLFLFILERDRDRMENMDWKRGKNGLEEGKKWIGKGMEKNRLIEKNKKRIKNKKEIIKKKIKKKRNGRVLRKLETLDLKMIGEIVCYRRTIGQIFTNGSRKVGFWCSQTTKAISPRRKKESGSDARKNYEKVEADEEKISDVVKKTIHVEVSNSVDELCETRIKTRGRKKI